MFFLKKKKKNTKLDESFERIQTQIKQLDESDNPALIRQYVMDSCEHIVSLAKEIDSYRVQIDQIEEYRSDVYIIYNLPIDEKARIRDTITNIINLTHRKKIFDESQKRIEDDTFYLLRENEKNIIDDIKRIEENEKYHAKIDKDVRALESNKYRLEMNLEELSRGIRILRRLSIVIFALVAGAAIGSIFVPAGMDKFIRLIFWGILFTFVFIDFTIFLKISRKQKEYRNVLKQINSTISLLNVERMRLVNVKKALDFELKFYDVISAAELTYLWEQYLITVKDMESERRNNLDLNYYIERMYALLKNLNLKYERRWVEQVSIFQNDDELNELKEKLDNRVDSLRLAIMENNNSIDIEREEIDRLMREHDFYVPEVMEILGQVDRITGKSMAVK